MSNIDHLKIYTDGGALNNPGPAAIAAVFYDQNGDLIWKKAKSIGRATNNVAEYQALIYALQHAKRYHPKKITLLSDSQLLVFQLTGRYKIKEPEIKNLFIKSWNLLIDHKRNVDFKYIPREKNREADSLVKSILGQQKLL